MTSESEAGESERGGFLSRWSRRKQADKAGPGVADATPVDAPALPAVETLGAGSDYTAFLQKGVAAAVQAQALHRAWTSDAAIAGFRGMAEYDWDFNATGYGRLWASDNVPKLLESVLGLPEDVTPVTAEATPEPDAPAVRQSVAAPVVATSAAALAEAEPDEPLTESPAPRRHGSAMPA